MSLRARATSRVLTDGLIARVCDSYQSWAAPASGEYAMNTMLLPGAYAVYPLKRRFIQEDGTVHPALLTIPMGFM